MSPATAIESIGQIHVSVDEIDRAVAFYRDTLGLELLFEVPEQKMAFFQCGEVRLYLGLPESEEYRSRPMLYFRVADIEATAAELKDKGVEFVADPHAVHKTEQSTLWLGFFKDSEGTNMALMSDVPA